MDGSLSSSDELNPSSKVFPCFNSSRPAEEHLGVKCSSQPVNQEANDSRADPVANAELCRGISRVGPRVSSEVAELVR